MDANIFEKQEQKPKTETSQWNDLHFRFSFFVYLNDNFVLSFSRAQIKKTKKKEQYPSGVLTTSLILSLFYLVNLFFCLFLAYFCNLFAAIKHKRKNRTDWTNKTVFMQIFYFVVTIIWSFIFSPSSIFVNLRKHAVACSWTKITLKPFFF